MEECLMDTIFTVECLITVKYLYSIIMWGPYKDCVGCHSRDDRILNLLKTKFDPRKDNFSQIEVVLS